MWAPRLELRARRACLRGGAGLTGAGCQDDFEDEGGSHGSGEAGEEREEAGEETEAPELGATERASSAAGAAAAGERPGSDGHASGRSDGSSQRDEPGRDAPRRTGPLQDAHASDHSAESDPASPRAPSAHRAGGAASPGGRADERAARVGSDSGPSSGRRARLGSGPSSGPRDDLLDDRFQASSPPLLLPLPVSLLYTHSPLPTVAPTRVPTVYSLHLSLGVSRAAALGRRGPRRPRGVAPPREPAGDEAWPACVVAASD